MLWFVMIIRSDQECYVSVLLGLGEVATALLWNTDWKIPLYLLLLLSWGALGGEETDPAECARLLPRRTLLAVRKRATSCASQLFVHLYQSGGSWDVFTHRSSCWYIICYLIRSLFSWCFFGCFCPFHRPKAGFQRSHDISLALLNQKLKNVQRLIFAK